VQFSPESWAFASRWREVTAVLSALGLFASASDVTLEVQGAKPAIDQGQMLHFGFLRRAPMRVRESEIG